MYCPDKTCHRAWTRRNLNEHSHIVYPKGVDPRTMDPERIMRELPCGHVVRNRAIMFVHPPCKHCFNSSVGPGYVPTWVTVGDLWDHLERSFAVPEEVTNNYRVPLAIQQRQEEARARAERMTPIVNPTVMNDDEDLLE
jgi:hypothetical protein